MTPLNLELGENTGVIVVDHGSRRDQSNQLLVNVVEVFRAATGVEMVEPAHMELAEPSIEVAFGRCVEQGAKTIVIFPYFLLPGRHWDQDIPALAAKAAKKHPGIQFLVTAPLGVHSLMAEIMGDRIQHCLDHAQKRAPECPLCEGSGRCKFVETPN